MTRYYREKPLPVAEHHYLIIDRLNTIELPKTLPLRALVTPLTAAQSDLYPWVLPLNALSTTDWAWLEERCRLTASEPPPGYLLLRSHQPETVVIRHLLDALFISDEKKQNHILRYYDPRVLFHLGWMADEQHLSGILRSRHITDWTYWLNGRWHTLSFNQDNAPMLSDEHSQALLKKLQLVPLINAVLNGLPEERDLTSREDLSRKIYQLAEAGKNWLNNISDLRDFVLHGLEYDAPFWLSKTMSLFLAQCKTTPGVYHQITRTWSEEDWLKITSENGSHKTKGFSV